jgi:hypothetical protein
MAQFAPQVIQPLQLGSGEGPYLLGDPQFSWHLLAEGDSWFTISGLPSSNLLLELRLRRSCQVFNLAYPGDTLRRMATLGSHHDLVRHLATRGFSTRWDALLISGGGNDVAEEARSLVLPAPQGDPGQPQNHVDLPRLEGLLRGVQQDVARIVALRDSPGSLSAGVPVVLHTYDYPTPRNAPATFLFAPVRGPWLYPVLQARGMAPALQQAVSDFLVDCLAQALMALDARSGGPQALPGVVVVDTRGTLERAAAGRPGDDADWVNEIHPNPGGYRKLAKKLATELNRVLP